jgi:hypothetical protein
VAENGDFNSLTGSEQFLFGTGFGVVTDIETGPNGSLFVVSLDQGAVHEIFRGDGGEPEPEPEVTELSADLTGANEVPGPGDEDGTGSAMVSIDHSTGELCYMLTAANITLPATAAHIHVGGPDEAGPPVVPLTPPDESGAFEGCVSDVDPALLQDIVNNPGGYYVNVHNSDYPDGAIRGQLGEEGQEPEPEPEPELTELFAEMTGANEVPGPGDEDGTGDAAVTINMEMSQVCYTLTVADILLPATAAHIHVGGADEAGAPVVPLNPPDENGYAEGCVEDVDPAVLQAIVDNPAGYYVNVHNMDYPDGAVRGQLSH